MVKFEITNIICREMVQIWKSRIFSVAEIRQFTVGAKGDSYQMCNISYCMILLHSLSEVSFSILVSVALPLFACIDRKVAKNKNSGGQASTGSFSSGGLRRRRSTTIAHCFKVSHELMVCCWIGILVTWHWPTYVVPAITVCRNSHMLRLLAFVSLLNYPCFTMPEELREHDKGKQLPNLYAKQKYVCTSKYGQPGAHKLAH